MSEYRYYEFAAIDQPLTDDEMAALRAVSTRATIKPSGFVNHYEWGGLTAVPLSRRFLVRHAKRGALLRRLSEAWLWQP